MHHRKKKKRTEKPKNKSEDLRVVSRDHAGDSLPSAMFGVQHGAHAGAGCTKIEALLRILVNLAGHGSLGRKS